MCSQSGGLVNWRWVTGVFAVQSLYQISCLWENISGFIKTQWHSIHSVPSCHKHLYPFYYLIFFSNLSMKKLCQSHFLFESVFS